MSEEEKERLEKQIASLFKKLQEIMKTQQEIKKREDLLNELKDAEHSIKLCKKMLKIIIPGDIIISLGMIIGREISLISAIILASIAFGLCTLAFGGEIIKEAIQARNIYKNKKEQFEEAKEKEEKDKELTITLSSEYTKIKEELLPLEYRLSWLKKNEVMQRSGFQLELIIFKFKEKEENMNEIEKKDFYNELWETYLEEQDYKKVHLYNPEVESGHILRKKL